MGQVYPQEDSLLPTGDLSSQDRVLALCAITQNALNIARRWSSSETGMDRPSLRPGDAAG